MQGKETAYLAKKQLSKDTTSRPYINWCCVFRGTKYKFWSPIKSGTYVWYIGFTFDLFTGTVIVNVLKKNKKQNNQILTQ
jgi:hypothetical protein